MSTQLANDNHINQTGDEVVMPYHLHMPSYFLETFTEYPYNK